MSALDQVQYQRYVLHMTNKMTAYKFNKLTLGFSQLKLANQRKCWFLWELTIKITAKAMCYSVNIIFRRKCTIFMSNLYLS